MLLIIIISVILLLLFYIKNGFRLENFWGGYFPTPYINNKLNINFGRYGINAATDQIPIKYVDLNSYTINPPNYPTTIKNIYY